MLTRLRLFTSQVSRYTTTSTRRLNTISRAMSTFTLANSEPACKVSLCEGLTQEQLMNFRPFKQWLSGLQHSLSLQTKSKDHTFHHAPYKLRSIDVQAVDIFGGSRIGFIKMNTEVTNDKGEYLPGAVFLRGGSVAMLLIVQPDDVPSNSEEDKHVLLTLQPRISATSLAFTELPAGMHDDHGTFSGAAAKEITEETGLIIPESELIDLTSLACQTPAEPEEQLKNGVYPSAGGCDEFISIFVSTKRVKRKDLKEWQGKLTGLRDKGEKITLKVVRLEELWKEGARDGKTLAAWALYQGLKGEGKI